VRHRLRFGEQSRAPLKLLRLELREDFAECEWLARANDPWDEHLSLEVREQNEAFQALRDTLMVREFLFSSLRKIRCATLKVYRERDHELIIAGTVNREDEPLPRIASLFMQAKLCGLQFNLSMDGAFEALDTAGDKLQLVDL
jgi:hypothetical protein